MAKKDFKTYTIRASDQVSEMTFVPARGGAASSLILPGKTGPRELLYCHDFFWDKEISDIPGGWPFCFPVCGRMSRQGKTGVYYYDGKLYELLIHGFSWYEVWKVNAVNNDSITLILRDNAATLARYPFRFEVKLHYQIKPGELICHASFTNCDSNPMPYYAGFHPYFLTPLLNQGKDRVVLDFKPIRRLEYNHHLTDIIGELPVFDVPTSIVDSKINEQLTVLGEDKNITLSYPNGDCLSLAVFGEQQPDLFSYVQLYHIPEKPFFCIEPWMSYPNAINSVAGVRWLQPNACDKAILKLRLDFACEKT